MNNSVPTALQEPGRQPVVTLARATGLAGVLGVLAVASLLSLRIGSLPVTIEQVLDALFNYSEDSYEQTVIRSLRLPRTLIGLGAGAALAVAGAAMQAVTRNPLAGPGILGVNSGAAFGVVMAVFFGGLTEPLQFVWFAFAGGLGASLLVYAVGSAGAGGATPVKLALAGVVISALLGTWQTAILLLDEQSLDVVRYWLAGSISGRDMRVFALVAPFLTCGTIGLLLFGHQLNVMNMGEDAARALGMRTGRVRAVVTLLVVLSAGASVAAAGPIGFVGLAVPHMVRAATGPDYRWILVYSLIVGPILILGADITGRIVARPAELQVGIVTALLGAPFLISLARRRKVAAL